MLPLQEIASHPLTVLLRSAKANVAAVKFAVDKYGSLDIFFANAGAYASLALH